MTGASGSVFGIRLLEALKESNVETHLIICVGFVSTFPNMLKQPTINKHNTQRITRTAQHTTHNKQQHNKTINNHLTTQRKHSTQHTAHNRQH